MTFFPSTTHSAPRPELSQAQARRLVLAYAKEKNFDKLPGAALEHGDDTVFPHYYMFSLLFNNPREGSAVIGNYLVDRFTGDMWDGTLCVRYAPPSVRQLQRRIWNQLHISAKEYRRLARRGPGCE
jgi:hypothetical protein